jgi:coenzyme F420 hydrogenase subunit beta
MSIYKNVSFVPLDNMCTGCGVCAAVCPIDDVITMITDDKKGVHQSSVNLDTCTDCTLCLMSCPPLTWSNEKKTTQYNELVGDYITSYAAYSNDEEIRMASASGGFITSFLIYLLENKLIQGALVVKRDTINPLISKPFIATTAEEIINAKGSKYSPVKFDDILKEIIEGDYKDLAVVGLPCHIEGIAKACQRRKKLNRKIKYKISIVCGQAPSFLAYDYIAKKLDIKTKEILDIQNRGGGWPGFMQIKTKDKEIKVPYGSKYSMGMVLSSPLFTPLACQMCVDGVGFEADISVGDAWLDKYLADKKGINLILVKNPDLVDIIEKMKTENVMTFFEESVDNFIEANKSVFNNKGKFNSFRMDQFLDTNRDLYSTKMILDINLNIKQKIKLTIFTFHLKLIRKMNMRKVVTKLNDYILLYFKALNLLKR